MIVWLWWFMFAWLSGVDAGTKCVKNKIELWSPTKCESGKRFFAKLSHYHETYSLNGTVIQPYLYPWLVELRISQPQFRLCSGVLINDRYILTAQNCIFPPTRENHVTIQLGFFNGYKTDVSEILQPRSLTRTAERIILHPYYNPQDPSTANSNLGLLLMKPVKYSKTIYPIQLPSPSDRLLTLPSQLAENVAWSFLPNSEKKLALSVVRLLSAQQCSNFNENYRRIITPGVICGVNYGKSNNKPCGEEHGDILVLEKPRKIHNVTILVGIAAWVPPNGKRCQKLETPMVYVRIDNNLQWIKDNTIDGLYCRY